MFNKSFMNYKRKELSPDITPLIDVVFLLLIFFMVATNFDKMAGMKIELPQSEAATVETVLETISVIIDKDEVLKLKVEKYGMVSFIETTMANLGSELESTINSLPDKRVGIIADRDVTHGNIVDIMTIIKNSGASAIDIEMVKIN